MPELVELPSVAVDEDVVSILRELLEKAEEGEVRGLFFVSWEGSGNEVQIHYGLRGKEMQQQKLRVVGTLDAMKLILCTNWLNAHPNLDGSGDGK